MGHYANLACTPDLKFRSDTAHHAQDNRDCESGRDIFLMSSTTRQVPRVL